jgi:hypothetical protein
MSEKVPILVVLGIDADGKWHASRFDDGEATLVARAAELMGFHVVRVPADDVELHGVAERLPAGRVFASGKAFVPFVAHATFDKLAALVEGGVTIEARTAAGAAAVYQMAAMYTDEAADAANELWAKIEVGTVVLAAADPELYGQSWWEAVVVAVDGDDLKLRWVEDPTEEPFGVPRRDVGLRHPAPME